ncbi:MAG: DNA repair protein RecO [Deltaproteobacteria bacterium]|nr:DNA repair protein RecO [Deltaproteobacteria bacterium]MBW1922113.1 DNA repair protein RecO [Deltaproteobacteria bacterium]MBW1947930.1 DNA repair protein RecO [Deltaproteobacteria bacterium]MBW2007335.1 DNA repair protein RecO [Deltaproteobacteria bacterium]MBW2101582.1 DNA repair protein RecO [Deltaproteobacteria bacterium]
MRSVISPAIILRIREFGESDLLVSFFAEDAGRLKGVAKGARRSRRRFPNCLDLFCLSRMEYVDRGKGDMLFLDSCRLINPFAGLRSDFSALSLGSYMVELTEILFPVGVGDRRMFALLRRAFEALDQGERGDRLRVIFEGRAMSLGGYGIGLECCSRCGRPYEGRGRAVFLRTRGAIGCLRCAKENAMTPSLDPPAMGALALIQSGDWKALRRMGLGPEVVSQIREVLKLHIAYRLGEKLKTTRYLE